MNTERNQFERKVQNEETPISLTIDLAHDGSRLDRYLKTKKILPYSLIQKGIRQGLVRINGKKVKASAILKTGDEITLLNLTPQHDQREQAGPPQSLLKLVTESVMDIKPSYVILNKPLGLTVQGGPSQVYSLDRLLPLTKVLKKSVIKVVHRLDKETTGCLLMARTRAAAQHLSTQFAEREIEKTYLCLCQGVPKKKIGVVSVALAPNKEKGVKADESYGKAAETQYEVLATQEAENISLVACRPISGRKHQIRAHLAHAGFPLQGDALYNSGDKRHFCLHAWRLSFHDLKGRRSAYEAPLSQTFESELERYGFSLRAFAENH